MNRLFAQEGQEGGAPGYPNKFLFINEYCNLKKFIYDRMDGSISFWFFALMLL